jgi:hypothetical protein
MIRPEMESVRKLARLRESKSSKAMGMGGGTSSTMQALAAEAE